MKKIAVLLASVLVLAGCAPAQQVEISDAWIKSGEMSVEGGMTAVYGTITNKTNSDIVFIGGQTAIAGLVEVHEMAMIDGQMKMQQIEGGLTIPAGQTAVLEPGGNHLMLMQLTGDVLAGDSVSVEFIFEGADSVTLDDVIAKPAEGGDEEYHSGEMEMSN